MLELVERLPPLFQSSAGHAIVRDLRSALQELKHVAENGWMVEENMELIETMTRYFVHWRPSFDHFYSDAPTFILASESTTMFAIMDMQKAAKTNFLIQ